LVAQLADRLGRLRPEIPLLVVGGRAPAEALAVAGRDLDLDLTRYPNLLQIPPTGRVSEIWGAARVVLMPSVVREAAGRCALEAMLNGVVPLVADQGGLAEVVGDAGIRLPPPPDLAGRAEAVPPAIVDAWWRALTGCYDDPAGWARRSARGRTVAAQHTLAVVGPAYAEWFGARLAPA
jgi:glycosyltransferase involved in cell wall biosynthesis